MGLCFYIAVSSETCMEMQLSPLPARDGISYRVGFYGRFGVKVVCRNIMQSVCHFARLNVWNYFAKSISGIRLKKVAM